MEGGLGPPAHFPAAHFGYTYAHGRIRNPQKTYVKRAVHWATLRWIRHSRSFKVILIGAGRNPGRCVVQCAINADVISETYEDMATGKRQIRRFQRPHSSLKTSQQETPWNVYKWFIFPETRVIGLHFCRWQCGSAFISFHVIMLQSRTLRI